MEQAKDVPFVFSYPQPPAQDAAPSLGDSGDKFFFQSPPPNVISGLAVPLSPEPAPREVTAEDLEAERKIKGMWPRFSFPLFACVPLSACVPHAL